MNEKQIGETASNATKMSKASVCRMTWTSCQHFQRDIKQTKIQTMTTLPLSEAKARLSELADSVARTHDRVRVTRNGREYVVLISVDDLESLEATIELLSDTAAQQRISKGEEEIAQGETTSLDELTKLMEERRAKGI